MYMLGGRDVTEGQQHGMETNDGCICMSAFCIAAELPQPK